jgi:2,4'-dihydroxyacetophenone dioxygenase
VHIKYFKIDPVQGEVVVLLKAPAGAELPRHHHTGTVIVYTVQGAWKYKEHNWIARAGSVVYETASSRHTPEALPGDEDVIAFETWRTAVDRYVNYCKSVGPKPRDLSSFGD